MTLVFLFTLSIGNVWAAVIDLTPDAEVTGTNKKWKEVGGGYVSRNGGGFTISTDGLQTGSGNTYVVFDVAAASTIEAKFINTSTTAYSDKTICCGKVSTTQWTAITNAVSDDTQYQLTIASGDKLTDQTISLPGTKSATTSCTFTATAAGKYAVYWTSSINNKVRLYEIEITESSTPPCTSPEIAWSTQPAGGAVGDADYVASVTTTPAEQTVTWTSSVPAAATVSNGTIHYVAPGFTKISAEFTYSGSDYCEEKVSVNKDIVVPISTDATGENDKYWYYTTAVPSGSPDNGLYYSGTKSGASMYGTKLNSDGYAWFVKPAVAGTLRVGAFKSDGSGSNYAVEVYACDDEGTISGDALGTLTTPHAGGVSVSMDIAADVEGIYIQRSTSSEGILYFVEFKAAAPTCSTEITTQPSDASLAIGDANPELSIVATNVASYAWKESSDGTSYDGSSTLSTSASYTPEVNDAVQTKYYYCEVTSDCDGTTVVKSDIVTVDVVASIVNVTGVSLDKTSQEFTLGGTTTTTLTATVAPNDATNKAVSWESSAPTKVSVTDNGDGTAEIEALAEGTATITVTTDDGSYTATCNVTVNPDPCHKYFYFTKAADATTAGVTNNEGGFFTTSASGSNGTTSSITIDEVEYAITNRTGNIGADDATIVSFTIPANKAGVLYVNMASSGNKGESSSRTLYLKKGGVTVVTSTNAIYGDGAQHNATISNIPSGTYTLHANNNVKVGMFAVKVCDATYHTITLDLDGGTGTTSIAALDGVPAYKPADPTKDHCAFAGWFKGADNYDWTANVTSDFTLTAHWTQLYTISFAAGEGSGDAPAAVPDKAQGETFEVPANTFTAPASKEFDKWNDGINDYAPGDTYTVGTANVVLTAQWKALVAKYTVIFKDGETTLDTKLFDVGSNPSDAGIDKTKPLYTFAAWQKDDADIALDDAFWATVVKDATVTLTARWAKAYATSVDLKAAATGSDEYTTVLDAHNIAYELTNTSWDDGTDIYNGLKIKGVNSYIKFNLKKGQLLILTVGYATNDVKIEVNDVDQSFVSSTTALSYFNYYAETADVVITVTKTANQGTASSIRSITIRDPYQVSFDENGGDNPIAPRFATPSVTLPDATKGTESLIGWFDGETKIGEAGESYTPTADITLVAHWEAVSTDARLASIEFSAVGTLSPAFDPEVTNYTYTMPYGTAAVPAITGATSVSAKAQDPIIGEVAAAWGEAQTIQGVAQSGDKKTYTITMAKAPKDGVCLVEADLAAGSSAASITATSGAYKDADNIAINVAKDLKLGGTGAYVKVAVKDTYFQDGDVVEIVLRADKDASAWLQIFADEGTTLVAEMTSGVTKEHPNYLTISGVPANTSALYLYRTAAADGNMNPYPTSMAVYRAMNPVLTAIQFNSTDVEVTSTTVAALLPQGTNLGTMTVTPTIYWNGAGTAVVTSNAGAWAWGDNTYRVTDKDGDYTDYTITLTEDELKHTVSFNTHGGSTIDPVQVVDGQKLAAAPADPTKDDYLFQGWAETEDGSIVDVTSFTISADKEFHAVWAPDGAIKLIVDGATPGSKKINDEAYYTGSPLTSVTISEVETPCVKLNGGAAAATAPYSADKNDNRVIAYCAQTTQTKIRVIAYNNTNNPRPYTISFVEEGQKADEADDNNVIVNLPTDGTIHTSDWYQFNSSKNRTIYITIPGNASNYHFLQVKVIESGTPIKKAGDLGYSMNFNIGRPIGVKQTLHKNFEGFDFYANNDYKVLQSTSMVISNATNDYIKFHAAAPMTLAVTTENAASFYVTKAAKGTDNETLSTEGGISYIDLDEAADWYISPKGGDLKIQKIEFIAPKCEQPTVVDMENIGLCEGDAFIALNVSASVSDGGTLHYAWFKEAGADDEAVGTDAASYTPEADGEYYVVVTNRLADHSDNSATSNTITVTHFAAAVITTAPLNKRGEVDDVVTLSVAATGKNLSYEWFTCDEDGSHEQAIVPAETGTSLNVTVTAGMAQWYKVKVYSDCGGAEAMAKVSVFVPTTPANVTTSILWDWKNSEAGFPTENTSINFANTSVEELFADVDAAMPNNEYFRSDMLYGIGQYAWRKSDKDGEYGFQGFQIRFYTEVAGCVRVYYRSPSSGQTSVVTIDGKPAGSRGNSWGWSEYVDVDANTNVVIAMTNGETGMTRVQKIEFLALAHRRTNAYNEGDLGTICIKDDAKAVGATVYELVGLDENGYLAFDMIESGTIEAGKPYLFEAKNASQISFYKTLNANHTEDAGSLIGMYGTFVDYDLHPATDLSMYYFSGRHIWAVKDFTVAAITIPAYRCYVDMSELQPVQAPAPAPGRRRVTLGVQGQQVVTSIDNLNAGDQPVKVMIDGQMYILRGEKMYDATGRLVK